MATKKYEIMALNVRTKLKELHLDGFGIQKINFEEDHEIEGLYKAEAELTEEQAQYLNEHGFLAQENEG